jgi:hypothetical protein
LLSGLLILVALLLSALSWLLLLLLTRLLVLLAALALLATLVWVAHVFPQLWLEVTRRNNRHPNARVPFVMDNISDEAPSVTRLAVAEEA